MRVSAVCCVLFLACIGIPRLAHSEPQLRYRFELVREPSLQLRIRLETKAADHGPTTFEVNRNLVLIAVHDAPADNSQSGFQRSNLFIVH